VRATLPLRLLSILGSALVLLAGLQATPAGAQAKVVQTPYQNPKALVDVYLDDPAKLASALNWVRGVMNPLTEAPYSMVPEDIPVIVLMHGTEIVTLARKNGWSPGGLIMVHGLPNVPKYPRDRYLNTDWTDGCIALSNEDMLDFWLLTGQGTPIEIRP
jgi:hypothetical protein